MRDMKTLLLNTDVPTDRLISSNIIYELKCPGCNACYVCLTTNSLAFLYMLLKRFDGLYSYWAVSKTFK